MWLKIIVCSLKEGWLLTQYDLLHMQMVFFTSGSVQSREGHGAIDPLLDQMGPL